MGAEALLLHEYGEVTAVDVDSTTPGKTENAEQFMSCHEILCFLQ